MSNGIMAIGFVPSAAPAQPPEPAQEHPRTACLLPSHTVGHPKAKPMLSITNPDSSFLPQQFQAEPLADSDLHQTCQSIRKNPVISRDLIPHLIREVLHTHELMDHAAPPVNPTHCQPRLSNPLSPEGFPGVSPAAALGHAGLCLPTVQDEK